MATQGYTIPFTLTENPVLSMPISLGSDLLPIGIQVVGKRCSDFRLLKTGIELNKYAEKLIFPLQK